MPKSKKKTFEVLLPPAVGYSFSILVRFFFTNRIHFRYYHRLFILGIINLINLPFRSYERLIINPRIRKRAGGEAPVFIVGHWRSGTTHLHNILTRDRDMGYLTTFQGVFPDTLFNKLGKFIFINFTQLLIPRTRKGDNVTLSTENPQEEEFALGDKTPLCYYYFWMFPKKTLHYYREALRYEGVKDKVIRHWEEDYKLLLKKSLKNTGGKRFLSKNPPNTARIRMLLKFFPDARFIHIHRNPVEVFLSTTHFFNVMMPYLQLQKATDEDREELVLTVYQKMMNDYLADRALIPEGNLVEVAFEDLEKNPMEEVERIYKQLGIPGFNEARQAFEGYLRKMSSYRKNRHSISRKKLDRVIKEWKFTMDLWDYDIPENIDIIDD
jgi:hypothetical protein